MTGTGNDVGAHIFSSDGRIFQVEYAAKCVESGPTVLGVCCRDGVVLAVENLRSSTLLEDTSNPRIYPVDRHIGVAVAGSIPDGVFAVRWARAEASNYKGSYDVPIPGNVSAHRLGSVFHGYTFDGYTRPLGTTVLMASYDSAKGPELHLIDPSGTVAGYHGCAAGKARTVAKTALEAINYETITCEEAVVQLGKIINDCHDSSKDRLWNFEMSWIGEKSGFQFQKVPAALIPAKKAATAAAA